MSIRSYRDLLVWQKAIDLAVECYQITRSFPQSELYGLTSQIRRAAVSVPSNIAEGHGRFHRREFVRHLGIANGSLSELETDFCIAARLDFIKPDQLEMLLERTREVGRMAMGLRTSLKRGMTDESSP